MCGQKRAILLIFGARKNIYVITSQLSIVVVVITELEKRQISLDYDYHNLELYIFDDKSGKLTIRIEMMTIKT